MDELVLLPIPPLPDPLPDLPAVWKFLRQKPVPLEDIDMPEEYAPIKCKSGLYVKPIDRRGILRRLGERFWEVCWMDGKVVPILGTYRRFGPTYQKPEGAMEREFCGAWDRKFQKWCMNPAKKCPLHCGGWAKNSGRFCPFPPMSGLFSCRKHGGMSVQKRAITKVKKIRETGKVYAPFMEPVQAAMSRAIEELKLGKSLVQEMNLYRQMLAERYRKLQDEGDSPTFRLELVGLVNAFGRARSETEQKDILSKIFRAIRQGADIARAENDVIAMGRELANLIKVDAAVQQAEQNAMSIHQAVGFIDFILGLLANKLADNVPLLTEIRNEIASRHFDIKTDCLITNE